MTTKEVPFKLIVQEVPPEPDFFPSIAPTDLAVYQGRVATYQVTVQPVAGFTGLVTLAVVGLPDGTVAAFDSNPVNPGAVATLTIPTDLLQIGTYDLTLTATA